MKKNKVLIIIIALIVIGAGAFLLYSYQQKIERQYQACLDQCDLGSGNNLETLLEEKTNCMASCREKYGK